MEDQLPYGLQLVGLFGAAVGSLTGVVALGWTIYSSYKSGARPKADLFLAMYFPDQKLTVRFPHLDPTIPVPVSSPLFVDTSDTHVTLSVRVWNDGQQAVTAESCRFIVNNRSAAPIAWDGDRPPCRIDGHDAKIFGWKVTSVLSMIKDALEYDGASVAQVRAEVQLSKGKPILTNAVPFTVADPQHALLPESGTETV